MRLLSFCSLFALCYAAPVLAADIETPSRIDSVTLTPDSATATRMAEIDLPAGASRLIFRGLPAALDPASLRVAGEGDNQLSMGAVDLRKTPAPVADGPFEAQAKSLRAERAARQVKVDALAAQFGMIQLYAQSGPDKLGDKAAKPADWPAAWDAVGTALARNGEDLRLARAAVAEVEAQIRALEAARPTPAPRGATQDVALDVEAAAPGKFQILLTYRVAGARWTPAYDARLDTSGKTGAPKLELIRRASITQRTGEDWSDVALSLATVATYGAAAAPEPTPRIIAFEEPPMEMAAPAGAMLKAAPAPTPMARMQATQQQASVDAGAYQAVFQAPGRVSLASDGTIKTLSLSTQKPPVELEWRVAPALDPRAFLSAHFVNGEQAPLLAGPVTLFRDGALVGQAALHFYAPGDGVDLGFGPDDRVTVSRAPVQRTENEPTRWSPTKVETRDFKTLFRNLHDFPVHIVATDQTPYSENAAISVDLLAQTTEPSEKDPDGKRGLLRWRFDLAPNESRELRLAYRMKWPADRDVRVP